MSMVLHLVKWDVRRFRILLSVWLLLVAANALHDGIWPAIAVAMEARQTVAVTGNLLGMIQLLFSLVLIAQIVHEHPVVGTTAFWMTRPIPRRALLTAKLILLTASIIVLPAVAELVLMIGYGVPPAAAAAVAGQTLFFQTLWLCLVLAFAAPTANMAKFAFAAGAALLAMWVVLMTVTAVVVDRFATRPPITPAQNPYDPTPGAVGAAMAVFAALAFLVVLYQTRNRVRAIATAAAGVAVALTIGSVWAWPLLAARVETPPWALDPTRLQLSAAPDGVKVRVAGDYGYEPSIWTLASAPIRTSGLEPGWSADASVREASVRVTGREPFVSDMRGPRSSPAIAEGVHQKNEVMRRLLGVGRLNDWSQQQTSEAAVVMAARTDDLRALRGQKGSYEGRFRVWLARHDIQAVLPLRVGSSVRVGAYRFDLDRLRVREARISLLGRESDALSMFMRDPSSRIEYYLRNRVTSEAVQASWRPLRTQPGIAGFWPAIADAGDDSQRTGFIARAVGLEFPSTFGKQQGIVFDDTWVERGELVIVRVTEAGTVERRMTIADFPIPSEYGVQ
jgi:hypothetical protein